jgi:hypothetical protein
LKFSLKFREQTPFKKAARNNAWFQRTISSNYKLWHSSKGPLYEKELAVGCFK